jgi:hypothetical protein
LMGKPFGEKVLLNIGQYIEQILKN